MHYNFDFNSMVGFGPFTNGLAFGLLIPLMIWSLVWKGLVLWVAARRQQTGWFILFLVLNTAGIGEIIYLIVTNGFKELKK